MIKPPTLLPPQPVNWTPPDLSLEEIMRVQEVFNEAAFQDANTYREQVYILVSLLHEVDVDSMDDPGQDRLMLSYEKIGKCFDPPKNHGSIIKELKKYGKTNCDPGRPYALTSAEIEILADELNRCKEEKDYPSVYDIMSFIANRFDKYPWRSTVFRTITQRIMGYKLIKSTPIEETRWNVQYSDIENFYTTLEQTISQIPVGFVFNLDESGECEYVDAHDIYVYVPDDVDAYEYPVDRATKRISLLHCIATDGSSCDPLIITPRKTVDNEVFDQITPQNVLIRYHPKGYLNYKLFTEWLLSNFVPYLTAQRIKYNYTGEAVIIMDGFRAHDKSLDELEPLVSHFQVRIQKIPEHSSNQVQPLDLIGFNLQKNRTKTFNIIPFYSLQSNRILAILHGLDYIRTSYYITAAFEAIGVYRTRISKFGQMQTHIVRMSQNKFIHDQTMGQVEVRLTGTTSRFSKHKPCEPNEIFPKRKEMKISRCNWTNQWKDEHFLNGFTKAADTFQKSGIKFYKMIQNPPKKSDKFEEEEDEEEE